MSTNKNIVKHISSGGFIFHKNKRTQKIFVLLIKNNKGEWWIPKGKLDPGETQLDAAFREIEEEVGLHFHQLKNIGFCDTFTYGYDLDDENFLMKDLFINVFEAYELYDPAPTDWNDLAEVRWVTYEDALNLISFTKDKLEKAYEIFIKSMSTVNSLYSMAIVQIQNQLNELECITDVASIVLYGSMYKKIFEVDIHDTDLIIVVKDTSKDFSELFTYLRTIFKNLDFHIFTEEEVSNSIAFYTREYVLEYLSKGISLYGKNPFVDLYADVTPQQYKESIFIRTVAHVQMTRKIYLSNEANYEYKMSYLKKYIQRIGKNMLLFLEVTDYDSLEKISTEHLFNELIRNELITKSSVEGFNDLKPLDFYYNILCDLSDKLILFRKKLL
jgi:8-oxo-dGTP pyrophosphatase MutT (NUDIX family)